MAIDPIRGMTVDKASAPTSVLVRGAIWTIRSVSV
jgi:YHS domain-containing protein